MMEKKSGNDLETSLTGVSAISKLRLFPVEELQRDETGHQGNAANDKGLCHAPGEAQPGVLE